MPCRSGSRNWPSVGCASILWRRRRGWPNTTRSKPVAAPPAPEVPVRARTHPQSDREHERATAAPRHRHGRRVAPLCGLVLCWMLLSRPRALPSAVLLQAAPSPAAHVAPGDIPPLRVVADPFPTFNGVAVDPVAGVVVTTDHNRKSLLSFMTAGSAASAASAA